MPPVVSPTPTPVTIWPSISSKDQSYAEVTVSNRIETSATYDYEQQHINMAAALLKLQSLNSTNRTLYNGLQNASNISQSSEGNLTLSNENNTTNFPMFISPRVGLPNSCNNSTTSLGTGNSSRIIANEIDVVLPQELYQKLNITQTELTTNIHYGSRGLFSFPFILLDCRSTKAFKRKHIDGAWNVNCANRLYCRRLRDGKMSIADLVTCEEGKHILRKPNDIYKEIIVYDEDTQGMDHLPASHPTSLVLSGLKKEGTRASLLKGGIQAFEEQYGEMCNSDTQNAQNSTMSPLVISTKSAVLPDSPGIENRPPPVIKDSCSIDAPMAQILPHLYVGGDKDAANMAELKHHDIHYILNVTNRVPCYHEGNANFRYCRIAVKDNGLADLLVHFDTAFQFIEEARRNNGRVLIHCQAGISRSCTVAIAYVMKYLNLSMDRAYNRVQECRPIVAPNLNFVGQLTKFEKTLQANRLLTVPHHIVKMDPMAGGCALQAHNISRPSTPINNEGLLGT